MSSILTHGAIYKHITCLTEKVVVNYKRKGFESPGLVVCLYMGAVVGYGVALQASCLEGFDSLGLHQTIDSSAWDASWFAKPVYWKR